jgi:hypothetical protein
VDRVLDPLAPEIEPGICGSVARISDHYTTESYLMVYMILLMGEERNAYRILVGKPEEKRPEGRPRCRWMDNIKIDLKRDRMRWYGLD